ncbi:hypothetical protein TAMA11512_23740 [Selenomonas sp. TAMA-11512]|uniref:hypothetical protein n=1 Tax=Selenomonas sp. TAMA-11512 TaxID=3095337 RepID=UPI003088E041|nr:hypothetical protein TAMA11512_23740 [Selenomonas sp. TAMA-11512]
MKLPGKKILRRWLFAAAPFIFFSLGCSPHHQAAPLEQYDEDMPGGHTSRTRTDVPHTVASTELASFSFSFDFNDPYTLDRTGSHFYTLKKEDGVWKLTADRETIGVTREQVDAIERMIRRYDLAVLNGLNEYTSGLPPLGNAFSFSISYASGESISAGSNTDRPEPWELFRLPFKRYVDELFVAAGHTEFAYPPEVFRIDSFSMDIRQPVENGIQIRSIHRMEKQLAGNYTVRDIAEERFDDDDFAPYLFDEVTLLREDGTYENVYSRSIPWTEELTADLQKVIAAQGMDIYTDPRATRGNAYHFVVQYESGRSIYRAAKGTLPTPQEADVENVFIDWTDRTFDAHRDEIETDE